MGVRVARLPVEQRSPCGVLVKEMSHDGGARPRQPEDDERSLDSASAGSGVACELDDAQPVPQGVDDLAMEVGTSEGSTYRADSTVSTRVASPSLQEPGPRSWRPSALGRLMDKCVDHV